MSLWGDEFEIKETPKVAKKVINKIKSPKTVKVEATKLATSKSVSLEDKLSVIESEVNRILGRYKEDTIVITSKDEFKEYIDASISNNIIAIDTETNNSLDPITCKLMGACIYTPGKKQAYIPVNHVDKNTGERLPNQLLETDIAEQFNRLMSTNIVMHNAKFDIEVIHCTCDCDLVAYWDTELAARILDENEKAALKEQYRLHIDSTQEKYSIEHLFKNILYEFVPPELFALYAATDPYITYKLYEWQKSQFDKPGNENLLSLFFNVEMPCVPVTVSMELLGVSIDKEYANRLSAKYHKMCDAVDKKISIELLKYKDIIDSWRKTSSANIKEKNIKPNKEGIYTFKKSKNEQLQEPPQVNSPTQLAILLYDVLNVPVIDKKTPRGTGEEILTKIDLPLCKLILEKRGLEKLIGTYIDKLPACVNSQDGRLHAHFNQLGAGTGRFSSSDPNLQNIPSHAKNIRLMFKAGHTERDVSSSENEFIFTQEEEIQISTGEWVPCKKITPGTSIITSIGCLNVTDVTTKENHVILSC